MPEKPNPRELRMVILFDPPDESFCVFSHNLSAGIKARITRRTTRTTARCVGPCSPPHVPETSVIPRPSTTEAKNWRCSWQVKETASRITSFRTKSFSARPASSRNTY